MDIVQLSQARLRLAEIEKQLEIGSLSLFERSELLDEQLELKEQLGDFERRAFEGGECENCSG